MKADSPEKEACFSLSDKLISHHQSSIKNHLSKILRSSDLLGRSAVEAELKNRVAVSFFNLSQKYQFPLPKPEENVADLSKDVHSIFFNRLNKMITDVKIRLSSNKYQIKYCCHLCRSLFGDVIFVVSQNKKYHCYKCEEKLSLTIEELQNPCLSDTAKFALEESKRLFQIYANHSKMGTKCPSCKWWIPNSYLDDFSNIFECPNPNCQFIERTSLMSFKEHAHPTAMNFVVNEQDSLDELIQNKNSDSNTSKLDLISSTPFGIDEYLDLSEIEKEKSKWIKESLDEEESFVLRSDPTNNKTKIFTLSMIKAFRTILERKEIEMISYLFDKELSRSNLKGSKNSFFPQPLIFQEYCDLILDNLPLTFVQNKKEYLISDYFNPNLNLFLGISSFEEEVTEHFTIKNKTEEKYFGEEDGKDYGKCFLGKIIDIIDLSSNESILSDLESYSFSVINLSEEIAPGTMVRVSHLRIAPSYTLGSLKILQVICSKIRARINKKMKEFAQHAK